MEREMPRPPRDTGARDTSRGQHDFLQVPSKGKDSSVTPVSARSGTAGWPPVPDLFDVITYFRARGDSFALIASIGFWVGEDPKKALTARGLKLWYEGELERRAAAKAAIR
jgi:hypothetical protein